MSPKLLIGALSVVFLLPCLISCLCCRLVIAIAPKIGMLDRPGERKIHTAPIPTDGGLGIWLATIIPCAALTLLLCGYNSELNTIWNVSIAQCPEAITIRFDGILARLTQLWILLALGSGLVILGVIDDRYGLPWQLRLGFEFLIAIVAVCCGWRADCFIDNKLLASALSVLWIVTLINSFNLLDNMDALSGGVATICAFFLALVSLCYAPNAESGEPQYFLGAFLILLSGAISGFLTQNRPPAKIFMGDAGAYFIGFLLATASLSMTYVGTDTPKTAVFVPIVVLATPLYDTISVVIVRLSHGKSPFVGDKNHYSHRLVALGLSTKQAVATIYLTTFVCAVGAVYLYQLNFLAASIVLIQTVCIMSLIAILEFAARRIILQKSSEIAKTEEERLARAPHKSDTINRE